MTIQKAFAELVNSAEFKEACKEVKGFGSKCRVYLSRYNNGKLALGAMVETLLSFGYKVDVTKGTVKKK